MQIETPNYRLGMNLDMPNRVYHSGTPGISKSMLDKIAQGCPLKFWGAYVDPNGEPEKVSEAKIIGDAIHSATLTPDLFDKAYMIMPDYNLRSPKGRAARDEWLEKEAKDAQVLTLKQRQKALDVAAALRRHPKARQLLGNNFTPEVSFYAVDAETGTLLKCRTDMMDMNNGIVVDLKSTDDASESEFAKSVVNYRYLVQEAWYKDVIGQAIGQAPDYWEWLVVEKDYPYVAGIYHLSQEDVDVGYALARRDLKRIIECQSSNTWPDYADAGSQLLRLPGWARAALGYTTDLA